MNRLKLVCSFVVALYAGVAQAQIFWTNGIGDQDWHNPGNWQQGVVPGPADEPHIDPVAGVLHPIITQDTTTGFVRMGINFRPNVPDRIDQLSGTFTNAGMHLGNFSGTGGDSVYNLFGGTLNATGGIRVGVNGSSLFNSTLNVNGPTAVINSDFIAVTGFGLPTTRGEVNLIEGTVNLNNIFNFDPASGKVNFKRGVLTLAGDQLGTVDFFIGNGVFSPTPGRTLVRDFDVTNAGRTTVYAIPEPAGCLLGLIAVGACGALVSRRRSG